MKNVVDLQPTRVAGGCRSTKKYLCPYSPSSLLLVFSLIHLQADNMSPLQLATRRGQRFMFQHVLRQDHTRALWTWGPVSQFQIQLDQGIDSTGFGASDVMEILPREDSCAATMDLILDDVPRL